MTNNSVVGSKTPTKSTCVRPAGPVCLILSIAFVSVLALVPLEAAKGGNGRGKGNNQGLSADLSELVTEINDEAERHRLDPDGLPLPFAAHWNRGLSRNTFTVGEVVDLIKEGNHLLPWAPMPWPGLAPKQTIYQIRTHESGFKELAQLGLPVTLISTQWEDHLCLRDDDWLTPLDIETPCLVDLNGNRQRRASEVGPIEAWYKLGRRLATDTAMLELFAWYPDPPLVILLSNNESSTANKEEDLRWHDGRLTDAGWPERYEALFDGMRDHLPSGWSDNLKFVGFNINPAVHFMGRWHGWGQYGAPFANYGLGTWDGGSSEYYLYSNAYSDFRTFSPQLEAMHYVAGLENVTYVEDPDWWMELSVWDGDEYIRDWYDDLGQEMSPTRWGGTVQYGLWLVRPRVVREFRNSLTSFRNILPYFEPIMAAVDRVWEDPDLRRFWRHGSSFLLSANIRTKRAFPIRFPTIDSSS